MSKILRRAISIPLALSLAACSMAPSYERPQSPVAEQLARLETDAAAAEALAAVDWREFYRDSHLQQLVEQALINNRDLRLAALNVEQVQAQYRIARAELLPNLGVNGSAVRQQVPASVSPTGAEYTATQYTVGLGSRRGSLTYSAGLTACAEVRCSNTWRAMRGGAVCS